jgi:hypothetical protein
MLLAATLSLLTMVASAPLLIDFLQQYFVVAKRLPSATTYFAANGDYHPLQEILLFSTVRTVETSTKN